MNPTPSARLDDAAPAPDLVVSITDTGTHYVSDERHQQLLAVTGDTPTVSGSPSTPRCATRGMVNPASPPSATTSP